MHHVIARACGRSSSRGPLLALRRKRGPGSAKRLRKYRSSRPGHVAAYCFASEIENSPLRTRTGRPSTNFATASSP